jgi:hypothetical protein
MALTIIKYLVYTLTGIILLAALIATPLVIKARSEGQRMYEKYDRYTRDTLAQSVSLTPYPIKSEYRIVHPWKGLKLLRFAIEAWQTDKFKRVNTLDASLMVFMKMYTLLILPNYNYNLPMLSVDIIFMGGKRVFVIELIDPANITDDNLEAGYAKMRSLKPPEGTLEKMEVNMEWAKDAVRDVSIHNRADRTRDDLLFDLYTSYLNTYLDMARNAQPIGAEESRKVKAGMEWYVDTLIAKGGPAVNVFKTILGPEKQKEYVRTVMFGLD